MTSERTPWRWVGIWAAAGAIASAVITALEGRPAGDIQDGVFAALVVCWSCAPYLAAYICCRVALPTPWVRPAAYGVLAYAAIDVATHWRAFHARSGAAEAIGLLCLPVWSPIVIASVTAVAMAISWATSKARHGVAVR